MARLSELVPDYETFVELGPEELGGLILRAMNTEASRSSVTLHHWRDDLFGRNNAPYPLEKRGEGWRILAEAWAWLEAQVLIVHSLTIATEQTAGEQ